MKTPEDLRPFPDESADDEVARRFKEEEFGLSEEERRRREEEERKILGSLEEDKERFRAESSTEPELTEEEIVQLRSYGVDNAHELDPAEAREQLRMLTYTGKPKIEPVLMTEIEPPESIRMSGTDEWAALSPEEKESRLRRRFEMRELIRNLADTREKYTLVEEQLNKRKSILGRSLLDFFSNKRLEKLQTEHESIQSRYYELATEYVGESARRYLKERQTFFDNEIQNKSPDNFLALRRSWHKLGELNLNNLLNFSGVEIKGRIGKIATKAMSVRTLVSLGLLGGGVAVGLGSAVGIAALAGRRALGGAGVAFGAYDLLTQFDAKKKLAFADTDLAGMSEEEIVEKMSQYEIHARLSGKELAGDREYLLLRTEYTKRANDSRKTIRAIHELYESITETVEAKASKSEKRRRYVAVGAGLTSVVAFSLSDITRLLAEKPELEDALSGVTPEEIKETIDKGLVLPPDDIADNLEQTGITGPLRIDVDSVADSTAKLPRWFYVSEAFGDESEKLSDVQTPGVEASDALPEKSLEPADTTGSSISEAKPAVTEQGSPTTEAKPPATEAQPSEKIDIPDKYVGTVKQGGSAWQAGQDLVKSGSITKEEFSKAWSNSASVVELPSGEKVHISELGLTHAGDQVVYVPETENIPAHFTVIDYAEDKLNIGSNADLARIYESIGKEKPTWLKSALEVSGDMPKVPEEYVLPEIPPEVLGISPDGINFEESFDSSSVSSEGVSPRLETSEPVITEEITASYGKWIDDKYIHLSLDEKKNIISHRLSMEFPNSSARIKAVQKATSQVFKGGYQDLLEEHFRESLSPQRTLVAEELVAKSMPSLLAQAQETSLRIFSLRQAFDLAEPQSKEWYYLRYVLRKMVAPNPYNPRVTILPDAIPLSIINRQIIP